MASTLEVEALNAIRWGLRPPDNQHGNSVRRHAANWLPKVGLAASDDRQRKHAAIDIPLLAAMTHPWATRADLATVHDWLAWLFEFDDQFDDGPDGVDPDSVMALGGRLLRILDGGPATPEPSLPICDALADIWRRLRPRTSPAWRRRFRAHVAEYFESYVWETSNRRRQHIPGVEEYLAHRQQTGAVHTCFDVLIPTLGIAFDQETWENPTLRQIEYIACEIITLSNDIISFAKEKGHGDYHNMVAILMAKTGCSMEAAVGETATMVADLLAKFDGLAGQYAWALARDGDDIGRYLFGLRAWIVGNYAWSLKSRRFAVMPAAGHYEEAGLSAA